MKTKKMLHQLNYKHIEREDYLLPSSLDKHNYSFIYGEVNPKHIVQIIKRLNHDCCNNFVDIGSGCGKLVIYVALELKFMKIVIKLRLLYWKIIYLYMEPLNFNALIL